MEKEKKPRDVPAFGQGAAVAAVILAALTVCATLGGTARMGKHAPVRMAYEPAAQTLAAWGGAGETVIPVGRAVGIKLFSDGVLVVGLSAIDTAGGSVQPGKESGLKAGDIILSVDGQDVDTIEAVREIVAQSQGRALPLQVSRESKNLQLSIAPAENTQGQYQLGVWLRDSMAGIGTVTFYDPASGTFAALGHGVTDVDTAQLMPLQSGSVMPATVSDVKVGLKGEPGELHGVFRVEHDLGEIFANTPVGIYGHLSDTDILGDAQAVPVAKRDEVYAGPAVILSNVEGDQTEEFTVEILQIYPAGDGETRNLMVQVTDERLLARTGGIVQGMSGSPILQNGKLVGAVTHVLINDPTRGYGILAENMIAQSGVMEQARAS